MDRICPFLALIADHRTAIDGYDSDHACHARTPPEPLDRARQAELCLSEAHRQCEYYLAYVSEHAAAAAVVPMPAADTHIARTRLIVEQEPRRLAARAQAPFATSPRRWLVAGGIAAVGVAAAATVAGGGFNGLVGEAAGTATPRPTDTAAPSPPLPTASPTAIPTPSSTPRQQTARPTATQRPPRTPEPTPEPQTYVVQAGDTLSLIATRFGTSVSALEAANGLHSDVINVGQVLVIP